MLEYEKKAILSEKEYLLLKEHSNVLKRIVQKNYYYDTEDFLLNRQGITYRIREKDGIYEVTAKYPYGDSVRKEVSHSICSVPKSLIFDKKTVNLHGMMETERIFLYRDEMCEIVIDKNTYLGEVDYELEIEYLGDCERYAIHWLWKIWDEFIIYGFDNEESLYERSLHPSSKSERFFKKRKIERK